MSELTRCNHCSLEELRRRHGTARVRTVVGEEGWVDVLVDGKRVASMMEITEHCVC